MKKQDPVTYERTMSKILSKLQKNQELTMEEWYWLEQNGLVEGNATLSALFAQKKAIERAKEKT